MGSSNTRVTVAVDDVMGLIAYVVFLLVLLYLFQSTFAPKRPRLTVLDGGPLAIPPPPRRGDFKTFKDFDEAFAEWDRALPRPTAQKVAEAAVEAS